MRVSVLLYSLLLVIPDSPSLAQYRPAQGALPSTAAPLTEISLSSVVGDQLARHFDLSLATVGSKEALQTFVKAILSKHYGVDIDRGSNRDCIVQIVAWRRDDTDQDDPSYAIQAANFYLYRPASKVPNELSTLTSASPAYLDRLKSAPSDIHFLALHIGLPQKALSDTIAYTFDSASTLSGTSKPSWSTIRAEDNPADPTTLAVTAKLHIPIKHDSVFTIYMRRQLRQVQEITQWPILAAHAQYVQEVSRGWTVGIAIPFRTLHRNRFEAGTLSSDNIYRPLGVIQIPINARLGSSPPFFSAFVGIPAARSPLSQPVVGVAIGRWFLLGASLNRPLQAVHSTGAVQRTFRPQFFIGVCIPYPLHYGNVSKNRTRTVK